MSARENMSPRETPSISSSSSSGNSLPLDLEGSKGRKRDYEGLRLSVAIQKSFGVSVYETRTIRELYFLSKYTDIITEMEAQRCFTTSYIALLFERHHQDKTIRMILTILAKRNLLSIYKYVGLANKTFGVTVYYTPDATNEDLKDMLRQYIVEDELRYEKQLQRKSKKTPEEILNHNEEVKRLSKAKKNEEYEQESKQKKDILCSHAAKIKQCYMPSCKHWRGH
jgi:hypothetical protein